MGGCPERDDERLATMSRDCSTWGTTHHQRCAPREERSRSECACGVPAAAGTPEAGVGVVEPVGPGRRDRHGIPAMRADAACRFGDGGPLVLLERCDALLTGGGSAAISTDSVIEREEEERGTAGLGPWGEGVVETPNDVAGMPMENDAPTGVIQDDSGAVEDGVRRESQTEAWPRAASSRG